nr:2OG-Fe(II) oxygenase [Methylobacterium sp. Leaf122]
MSASASRIKIDEAHRLRMEGCLEEAGLIFTELRSMSPHDPDVMFLGGVLAKQRGMLDTSYRLLLDAYLMGGTKDPAALELSDISYLRGDLVSADDYARQALQGGCSSPRLYSILVRTHSALGNFDSACSYLNALRDQGVPGQNIADLEQTIRLGQTWHEARRTVQDSSPANLKELQSGLVISRQLLSDRSLGLVRSLCSQGDFKPGTVVGPGAQKGVIARSTRRANVAELPFKDSTVEIYLRSFTYVAAVAAMYKISLAGPVAGFQLTEYRADENGFYDWHVDTGKGRFQVREISFSLLISSLDEFEGGELQFETSSGRIVPELEPGSAAIFRSGLRHRVTPVSKGARYSLVGWFSGIRRVSPNSTGVERVMLLD